jgi:hypothetical protein
MLVKFKLNLGSRDAESRCLDSKQCGKGMECEVSEEAGQWLIRRNFAVEITKTVKGIADRPEIGVTKDPEIKAEQKATPAVAKKQTPHHKES